MTTTSAETGENHHASEIQYTTPEDISPRARNIIAKSGEILFSAYGCVLTERRTPGGTYVYTAVSLTTGQKHELSRRKNLLAQDAHVGMAERISSLPIRGDGLLASDKPPGEKTQSEKLIDTASHIFREILPRHGYAVRDRQIELATHILEVISRRGITLAESEVGTGKTHAYLIAAVLAKRGRLNEFWLRGHYHEKSWIASAHMPVVISTSSIALQQAIVEKYIPELSSILLRYGVIRTLLTAVVRKGKEHYICEQRLLRYFRGADERTQTLLSPFIGTDAPFDLTNADTLTPYMKRRICVLGVCDRACKHRRTCRYHHFQNTAASATIDFQITNHNYFLADIRHRVEGRQPLLPNYQLVVMDEAHKFLQAARSMYGVELLDSEIPTLARDIHAFLPDQPQGKFNIHRMAKKLAEHSEKLFEYLRSSIPEEQASDDEAERFSAAMDDKAAGYLSNLSEGMERIAEAVSGCHIQPLYRERMDKAMLRLERLRERVLALRKQSKLIYWLEKRAEGEKKPLALCSIPKDLGERLQHDIWSRGVPFVLTSGTLSASGDFTRTKETLGLNLMPENRVASISLRSPFDYRNNVMLYISERVPFPDNKDKRYIAAVADEVVQLVKASHGHAAVLFTSYNVMGQVFSMVKRRGLSFPLFRLERGGTAAIECFRESENGVLFASGALWEGIDIPGDALSMLIIVKLPFPVPDPIGDYERTLCGDMETYKRRAIIPDTLVKLMQGFGRLIRSETDTGVCVILDVRAGRKGAYRRHVLGALPYCGMGRNVGDIVRFIRRKKSPGYFTTTNHNGGAQDANGNRG